MRLGKKTFLKNILTKPAAVHELLPGFRRKGSYPPRVVYVASMPRTGSTLVKRYFGDHPQIKLSGMSPSHNYMDAWIMQRLYYPFGKTVLDKRTKYINHIDDIFRRFGGHVRVIVLVRDPRDQLLSLLETDRHAGVPRDRTFWAAWYRHYSRGLAVLQQLADTNCARLLRYEDMVACPVEIKKAFLAWAGLQTGELTNTYSNTRRKIAAKSDTSEDWKCHTTNTVHQGSLQKWRTIDADTQTGTLIQTYRECPQAAALMEQLGYVSGDAGIAKPAPIEPGFLMP